jgi:succinate-acetate transporter protein
MHICELIAQGSYNKKRVLMVFIIFGGLSTLLQGIFEISLMTAFGSVAGAIKDSQTVSMHT